MNRTINTAAEFAALPVGSVVRNLSRGITAERLADGRGVIPGNPTACPWDNLWSAGSHITVLHDPSAPATAPVVSDAAVEAAARAVRRERAFEAAAAFGVPLDSVPQCAEMIAYAALSAALPHLGAAPSATREDVSNVALAASSVTITDSPHQKAQWLGIADALLARFTITPRTDR